MIKDNEIPQNITINNHIKHIKKLVFDYQGGEHGTQIKYTEGESGNAETTSYSKNKTLRNWLLGIIGTLIAAIATLCFEYWKITH